jgi:hypothetical protein
VKLGDLVTIGLEAGVYALLALSFVIIYSDSALDREAVWGAPGHLDERAYCRRSTGLRRGSLDEAVGCVW